MISQKTHDKFVNLPPRLHDLLKIFFPGGRLRFVLSLCSPAYLLPVASYHILMIDMPPRPPILTTIGNESRLRILLALAKHLGDAMTVYKIAKFSGLERKVIRPHLRKLVEAELVQATTYGPIFVYRLNRESTPVQRLMDLFNDSRLLGEASTPLICYPMRR